MQTFQALGAPKKGRPAFGDITNAAAAARHIVSSEEEVSAQLQAANSSYAIDSARDVQHQRQSLLCNIRHQ